MAQNLGVRTTAGLNRSGKFVKMVQARCRECNPRGEGRRGWWETCTHDPYFTTAEVQHITPVLDRSSGKLIKTGETIEVEYVMSPNIAQIADDPKMSSGQMVRNQLERGSKFLEDVEDPLTGKKYIPVCDYFNCYEPAVKKWTFAKVFEHEGVQTVLGKYCSRDHAACSQLRLEGVPIYAGVDKDIQRRRMQLDAVPL